MDDGDLEARQDPRYKGYYEAAERLREEPENVRRARAAGKSAAVRDQAVGFSVALTPGSTMARMGTRALRVMQAGKKGGVRAAAGQAWNEYVDELKSLPFVSTYLHAEKASDASVAHDAYTEEYERVNTGVSAANDALLVAGVVKGVAASRKITVYNARTTAGITQAVLEHIDPTKLNPESRFGPAVYVAEQGETALREVAAHGGTASHVIRYDLRIGSARVFDLQILPLPRNGVTWRRRAQRNTRLRRRLLTVRRALVTT